uniref:hypothetical protein n=1 Tax=Shewanella sp. TaxID=50422 RepID=UPI004048E7F7
LWDRIEALADEAARIASRRPAAAESPLVVGRRWQRWQELHGESPPPPPQRVRVPDDEESGFMSFALEDEHDDNIRRIRLDEISRGWRGCGGL